MRYRITSPVTGFSGRVAGTAFADGVGHTSSPGAVAYFRRRGYRVEEDTPSSAPLSMPARSASKGAWLDYAVSRGMPRDEAEAMTRDQLATHYHGEEEGA